MTTILGIETSCDETAAAVVQDGHTVRSNAVASQHELHAEYGGVVPEIASRAHLQRMLPILSRAMDEAELNWHELGAISVGHRPGLIGSLLVGLSAAKALSWSLGKPLIGVDHVRAHLWAAKLHRPDQPEPDVDWPMLGLVVSGGHTSLYRLDEPQSMELIGWTIDDAVGEAYDKAAIILGLGYPGGPKLDRLAQSGEASRVTRLPRSLLGSESLNFSFSGLKTALLYAVRGKPRGKGAATTFERSEADLSDQQRADLAAAFQEAAIGAVILKLERAIQAMRRAGRPPKGLVIGGGVSANSLLRKRAMELGASWELAVHLPDMAYCMDNAAMIAGRAWLDAQAGRFDGLELAAVATTQR
jgi:N6-L-threonylcarbamoyladenine synthase